MCIRDRFRALRRAGDAPPPKKKCARHSRQKRDQRNSSKDDDMDMDGLQNRKRAHSRISCARLFTKWRESNHVYVLFIYTAVYQIERDWDSSYEYNIYSYIYFHIHIRTRLFTQWRDVNHIDIIYSDQLTRRGCSVVYTIERGQSCICMYIYIIYIRAAGFTLRNEKKCLPGFQLEKLKSS